MCHAARLGNMFFFCTIINYIYNQLMGLFEFLEKVFVSKIAINTRKISMSLYVLECLKEWTWSEVNKWRSAIYTSESFQSQITQSSELQQFTYYMAWGRSSECFCVLPLQCLRDLLVNDLVSLCLPCLVYTSSSGCWTITRQQKEWAFPEALFTTTTYDTVRNTNWTQSMLLLLENL